MQIKLPNIEDFGVSPDVGFLPPEPPLTSLPSSYKTWDTLTSHLPQSIASKTLRREVSELPVLSAAQLTTPAELHRAFVVLGFLVHSYVWCDGSDRPEPHVPVQLGEPYLQVCERLGMQPTLSYAGLCLWNWRFKVGGGTGVNGVNGMNSELKRGLNRLDDLDCLVSFTGTRDEAVFYLVPVMVEAKGGRLVKLLLEVMKEAAPCGEIEPVVRALEETRDTLPKMTALIKFLHESCDPKIFYHKIRPFYPGAKGMEQKGMPDGVVFHRADGKRVSAICVGGSAAQSSYFQFLDSVLGVKHTPVGNNGGETVFQEMHAYMPFEHRAFLNAVAEMPSLRAFVESHPEHRPLINAYNGCLDQLSSWRSRHIGVVTTHVVSQSRKEQPKDHRPNAEDVTEGLSVKDESGLKGTGGSALIPFLKQAKVETLDARR